MARTFTTVTVLGSGVLGSQIAMQAAWHGKNVIAYDPFPAALEKLPDRWEFIRQGYARDLDDYSDEAFQAAVERITPTSDLKEAVGDTDLIIEAVPENLDLKRKTWQEVGELVDSRTLLATNTSSLLPSDFADASGSPERFLAIHYANNVWLRNTAEIMGTEATDPEAVQDAIRYAEETGMVPVHVHKETPGYILNSLLIPWLFAGAELYVNGVGTPEEIDKAWRIATGSRVAPFTAYDTVGFNVASHIAINSEDPAQIKFGNLLKEAIEQGFSGKADRKGFYLYNEKGEPTEPNPEWVEKMKDF
ncbi:3-hydroxyacyl-CoA dehydrogenase [Corynebacterium sp. 153RC1]|uniref:3-hydroxyacyl-CoA dehydrogenase n=1 Tax=Corynebacterium TaxID=1716 RepID=UPI00211C4134|nr:MULTISPECIES: 3-hydroxyacyl-CoA dehydrogenase [unclassified Corynebacterium]MCQ9342270.1 3-hydroxyacyl-CoA dehydrogenase [Corynebacterium sp. 76QC2CO]MCQ9352262.1 3-hydroxyacyl-CoA dehydrogenase [Corynebacterium sp. 209RC1]MCQ9355434.1 3-hydroxyacyl-CoA dehydrogenase [Corynebacterium sp. 1222RC1]MCQ9356630.1 3-hydroxyacyl-CoA dehydrogenase [Corynebacterium sp. 122RC1]MCQ9359829.1 3-hydroxyacyl-CoA dehydrogenase [Corynebacterium sp. 142RC1]